jgi:flagellar biosynthesis component FlhA
VAQRAKEISLSNATRNQGDSHLEICMMHASFITMTMLSLQSIEPDTAAETRSAITTHINEAKEVRRLQQVIRKLETDISRLTAEIRRQDLQLSSIRPEFQKLLDHQVSIGKMQVKLVDSF